LKREREGGGLKILPLLRAPGDGEERKRGKKASRALFGDGGRGKHPHLGTGKKNSAFGGRKKVEKNHLFVVNATEEEEREVEETREKGGEAETESSLELGKKKKIWTRGGGRDKKSHNRNGITR